MHALLTIPRIYVSSKCLLPLEHPGSKWQNVVVFATVATTNRNITSDGLPYGTNTDIFRWKKIVIYIIMMNLIQIKKHQGEKLSCYHFFSGKR